MLGDPKAGPRSRGAHRTAIHAQAIWFFDYFLYGNSFEKNRSQELVLFFHCVFFMTLWIVCNTLQPPCQLSGWWCLFVFPSASISKRFCPRRIDMDYLPMLWFGHRIVAVPFPSLQKVPKNVCKAHRASFRHLEGSTMHTRVYKRLKKKMIEFRNCLPGNVWVNLGWKILGK